MITSNHNPKIKRVRRLLSDRGYRRREEAYVMEGTRWLQELVRVGLAPELLLASESWLEEASNAALLANVNWPVTAATNSVLATASATETNSGVLAVVPMAPVPLPERPALLLILDRVADPGNLGTMIRTAAAAGVDGVLLGPGCVDPYNPKVVRATMGALLRLPVHVMTWPEIGEVAAGLAVWLAAAGGTTDYTAVDWRQPVALVIGNEASGVGPEALALGRGQITIPMARQTESLNASAAAAVILFEIARQRAAS